MSVRSLNKVMLIGNLTRDPELRYTPQGTAVCTFGLATNRQWIMDSGEKREEAEFHRIVSWNKLAELCSQLLTKGRKVYVEGRLQTRTWTGQDGRERQATEIVIDDMIILDPRRVSEDTGGAPTSGGITAPPIGAQTPDKSGTQSQVSAPAPSASTDTTKVVSDEAPPEKKKKAKAETSKVEENTSQEPVVKAPNEEINPDDIPF